MKLRGSNVSLILFGQHSRFMIQKNVLYHIGSQAVYVVLDVKHYFKGMSATFISENLMAPWLHVHDAWKCQDLF